MKNSADLGGCYPPRPSASVDNTLLDLQNSSYPTQPHSIIAKYHVELLRGSYSGILVMRDQLILFSVKHEFRKLFFVIRDVKVLRYT